MTPSVPFAIHVHSAQPHQRGRGTLSETGSSYPTYGNSSEVENRDGPVIHLVRDGKALNERGRALLRKVS